MLAIADIIEKANPGELYVSGEEALGVIGWRRLLQEDFENVLAMMAGTELVGLPQSWFWDC